MFLFLLVLIFILHNLTFRLLCEFLHLYKDKSPWTLPSLTWKFTSRSWDDGCISHTFRDFCPTGQTAWPSGPYLLTYNDSDPARDPSFENNSQENRCLPESPVLPRWEKRLRSTGSVLGKAGDRLRLVLFGWKSLLPRSLLNGWKLLFVKGTCTNVKLSSQPCLNLSQNKGL